MIKWWPGAGSNRRPIDFQGIGRRGGEGPLTCVEATRRRSLCASSGTYWVRGLPCRFRHDPTPAAAYGPIVSWSPQPPWAAGVLPGDDGSGRIPCSRAADREPWPEPPVAHLQRRFVGYWSHQVVASRLCLGTQPSATLSWSIPGWPSSSVSRASRQRRSRRRRRRRRSPRRADRSVRRPAR